MERKGIHHRGHREHRENQEESWESVSRRLRERTPYLKFETFVLWKLLSAAEEPMRE
jgi:hypothetical protein